MRELLVVLEGNWDDEKLMKISDWRGGSRPGDEK
jgi:hypothetical protein